MKNTMTNEQTKQFIDLMNYYDNDSIPVYKTFEDVAERYGEMINAIVEEFLELFN